MLTPTNVDKVLQAQASLILKIRMGLKAASWTDPRSWALAADELDKADEGLKKDVEVRAVAEALESMRTQLEQKVAAAMLRRYQALVAAMDVPNGHEGDFPHLGRGAHGIEASLKAVTDETRPGCDKMAETGFFAPWLPDLPRTRSYGPVSGASTAQQGGQPEERTTAVDTVPSARSLLPHEVSGGI